MKTASWHREGLYWEGLNSVWDCATRSIESIADDIELNEESVQVTFG